MAYTPLSPSTRQKVAALFGVDERDEAERLLARECGSNLPLISGTSKSLERLRLAALKVSGGDLDQLYGAIDLAQEDWRDLLMAAGFGHDTEAHKRWLAGEDAL